MKKLTEEILQDIMKLKYGRIVDEPGSIAYVSNKVLAKVFGVTEH